MTLIKIIMAGVHHGSLLFIPCHLINLCPPQHLSFLPSPSEILLFSCGPLKYSIVHSDSLLTKFSPPAPKSMSLSLHLSLLLALSVSLLPSLHFYFIFYTHTILNCSICSYLIIDYVYTHKFRLASYFFLDFFFLKGLCFFKFDTVPTSHFFLLTPRCYLPAYLCYCFPLCLSISIH